MRYPNTERVPCLRTAVFAFFDFPLPALPAALRFAGILADDGARRMRGVERAVDSLLPPALVPEMMALFAARNCAFQEVAIEAATSVVIALNAKASKTV